MSNDRTRIGDAVASLRSSFLSIEKDRFSCHHVNLDSLSKSCSSEDIPILVETLSAILPEAKSEWNSHGVRAVWAELPLRLSQLIAPLAEHNFEYHHVEAPDHLTLTLWLSQSKPNSLPPYANHSVGVAGVVVREDNKVLVIQERFYPRVGGMPYWKFPGGLGEVGEDFSDVARRETREETGVDTEFVCVLCTRHLQHFRWDISDLYTACLMRLRDPNNFSVRPDPEEIANCCWMDIDEFLARPNISSLNRFIIECYQEYRRTGVAIGAQPHASITRNDAPLVYSAITAHLPTLQANSAEKERASL